MPVDLVAGGVRPALVGFVQRRPAPRAAPRRVGVLGIHRQALRAAVSGRALAAARATRLDAVGLDLRPLPRAIGRVWRRRRVFLLAPRRAGGCLRRLLLAPVGPVPGGARARRPRAVGGVLPEPLARRLQIRQRLTQQDPRLLQGERIEVGVVELSQIVIAQVHAGGVAAPARRGFTLAPYSCTSSELCLLTL